MPNILTTPLVANGSTPWFSIPTTHDSTIRDVFVSAVVASSFGGGTLTLETRRTSAEAALSTGVTLTGIGQRTARIFGSEVRVTLSGATAPNISNLSLDFAGSPSLRPVVTNF